ncbi:MAG: PEP-CTERM sorting domain-containing protein, partial [Caldimonas sp.]
QAAFDSVGYDGSLGSLQIINQGGSVTGAGGGSVVFRDDSVARGSFLVIVNGADTEGTDAGTLGGRTRFADRSQAGELTIHNAAGRSAAGAGQTSFENGSNAGHARIENRGGQLAGTTGGQTLFRDTAGAGSATIVNAAGEVTGGSGGVTRFTGQAGAGNAYISNESSASAGGGGRGSTLFADSSSAQGATIDNQGGFSPINAFTIFSQSASAGNATITNFGGRAAGAGGGLTQFLDNATAGSARLVMAAGGTSGAAGGQVMFFSTSSAGSSSLDLRGASVTGAEGGGAYFQNSASAGTAQLTLQGSQVGNPSGPEGAIVVFNFNATAASASFVVGGNAVSLGTGGRVRFVEAATAANATFTTLAGYDIGGRVSFEGTALLTASAGNSHITNGSRVAPSGSTGDFGGATLFLAHSTADHAVIVNEAGRTAFGAQTVLRGDSTAANASITNAGGGVGDRGGITFFQDTASAGHAVIVNAAGAVNANGITRFEGTANAAQATLTSSGSTLNSQTGGQTMFADRSMAGQSTLVAEGGSNGGSGGRIVFQDQATGGTARVVLQAGSGAGAGAGSGGVLDISGTDVWVSVGSIEGGGLVSLGARSLIVIGPVATTFSGVISGTAPPVFPSLTVQQGSLTLTGANPYAGRTSIGDGVNAGSGKLVVANASGSATGSGEVQVQRGGTLAGSGFIAGPVTLRDGGTIAPGDPVTLTLRDSLTWDGGGVIRLVLGADSAGSDHLRVGTLIRGDDGPFVFDLVDFGITAGAEYDLLSFASMAGFAASDFQATGLDGSLALHEGVLAFTASGAVPAVPEPSTWALLLVGLFGIRFARKTRR